MIIFNDFDSIALVTPHGIEFKGSTYSCSSAIAQQWFSPDSPYYLLRIPAVYSDITGTLTLLLDSGDVVSTSKLTILNITSEIELNNYFQKINQLKLKFKAAKQLNNKKRR